MFYLPFILFILFLIPVSSNASEGRVIIGIENLDYAPLVSNRDGVAVGKIPDLIRKVARINNVEVEIVPYPVARLKKEAAEGRIDIQFPDNPNWNVDITTPKKFSVPITPYSDCYFSKTKTKPLKLVGTPLGFTVVSKSNYSFDIANATSIGSLFQMLDKNRIDAIYLNKLVAFNYSKKKNLSIKMNANIPCDNDYFYFSSNTNHEFILKINKFIKSVGDDSFIVYQ